MEESQSAIPTPKTIAARHMASAVPANNSAIVMALWIIEVASARRRLASNNGTPCRMAPWRVNAGTQPPKLMDASRSVTQVIPGTTVVLRMVFAALATAIAAALVVSTTPKLESQQPTRNVSSCVSCCLRSAAGGKARLATARIIAV